MKKNYDMMDNLSDLPIHIDSDFIYLRMVALTWIANYGYMPQEVQANSGELLTKIIKNYEPEKAIVINFYGVVHLADHSLDKVSKILDELKRKIIIINSQQIFDQLNSYIKAKPQEILPDKTIIVYPDDNLEIKDIFKEIVKIENNIIKKIVKSSYIPFSDMKRLQSTPVNASGIFNARKIISNRKDFIWTCLIMSESLTDLMDKYKPSYYRLLAVSLRGSPFAGALGILNSIDIEIIDHMGPYLKILEGYSLRIYQEDINYIYIGDFILFGTEVKIAETYVAARNCIISHGLVIGSLYNPEDYHYEDRDHTKIHSLVKLSEANPNIKFEIKINNA